MKVNVYIYYDKVNQFLKFLVLLLHYIPMIVSDMGEKP